MNQTSPAYVVEWSPSQQQIHIFTVEEMLEKNLGLYLKDKQVDYFPLAFAASHAEASKICRELEAAKGS